MEDLMSQRQMMFLMMFVSCNASIYYIEADSARVKSKTDDD